MILTDSDAAGFMIRSRLKGAIDPALVKHAYIPDIYGRERRKSAPSREGKLGVEGMERGVLIEALRRAGGPHGRGGGGAARGELTKADLAAMGLAGRSGQRGEAPRASEKALTAGEAERQRHAGRAQLAVHARRAAPRAGALRRSGPR